MNKHRIAGRNACRAWWATTATAGDVRVIALACRVYADEYRSGPAAFLARQLVELLGHRIWEHPDLSSRLGLHQDGADDAAEGFVEELLDIARRI